MGPRRSSAAGLVQQLDLTGEVRGEGHGLGVVRPSELRRPPRGGAVLSVFTRAELELGSELSGPCVIEEFTCAVRVPSGFRARVERTGVILESAG